METPTPKQSGTPENSIAPPVIDDGVVPILKRLGPAALLGGIATVFPLLGSILLFARINQIGQWLREHGAEGVIAFTGAFVVLAGVALLPTYAVAILGGWAFGFPIGAAAALIGFTGAATIGYVIGRFGSGDRVQAIISEKPRWKIIRDALVGGSFLKTLGIVTLVRLPPNSPFAISNLVFAGVKTNPAAYVIGTAIGMAPRTFVYVYVGSAAAKMLSAGEAAKGKHGWIIAASVASAAIVLGILWAVATRALKKLTEQPSSA